MSSTLSLSSRVSCRRTSISGLISLIESRALSAFDRPTSDWPWMIWRCRVDSSTAAKSPIPGAAPPGAGVRDWRPGAPPPPGGGLDEPGGPEPAGTDREHLGVLQPLLPVHPDVG